MRRRQGLRPRSHIRRSPTVSEKLMGQTHAIARPPTAVTKSYGASGDIWDILRFGSPTALLSKGLITPEQYASLMEQQASAENPLPRYAEERQELIEGPLPVKPLEDPSVEFLSEIFGDPTNLLLGGVGMAGMASKKVLTKGIKSLSKEGGALNRVFQGNEPLFANRGMDETADLLAKLKAEGAEGDIFIARDKLKAMIKENDPNKPQIYNKQIREYAGFDKWLDEYKNLHVEGKKQDTTVSLKDLEDFWAENNLDIREVHSDRFTTSYFPEGGKKGKMAVLTYHGKNRPMSLQTSNNLDQLANKMHQKTFDELDKFDQAFLENIYPVHYPEDTTAQFAEVIDPSTIDKAILGKIVPDPVIAKRYPQKTQSEKSESHHGIPNAIGHMRYDERPGIGAQAGEKHLSFHETQSDWAQKATREGVFDIGKYDDEIYELQLENRNLTNQIQAMDSSVGRPPEGEKLAEIINDNHADINILRKRKKEIIDKMHSENAAPRIPFIFPKDQHKWLRLMLKRQIKMGVDGDFDRVTFGSRELAENYGTVSLRDVEEIKFKKVSKNALIKTKKKRFNKEGEPEGLITLKGDEYPYLVEGYDRHGNMVNKEVNHYSKESLHSTFGKELAEKIIKQAKLKGKTVIKDIEGVKFGAQNLDVLYNKTIPKILKEKEFKEFDLELEIIPLGTTNDVSAKGLITSDGTPVHAGGNNIPPDREFNPAWLTDEQRIDADVNTRNILADQGVDVLEGVDWDSFEGAPGLHDRLFSFHSESDFFLDHVGLEGEGIFHHQYKTSGQYKTDLNRAVNEGAIHPDEGPELLKMYKAMKHIEINNNVPSYAQVVDEQWVRLMDPETRAEELTHIKEELRDVYEIEIYDDGVNKPTFKYTEAANVDDFFTADKYRENQIAALQANVGDGTEDIVESGMLVGMFMDTPDLFRASNLMQRYEIAGDPLITIDPELSKEVLTKDRVWDMPVHLQQYTVEFDGNVHPRNLEGVNPDTTPTTYSDPDPGITAQQPRSPVNPDTIEWDQLRHTQEGLDMIDSFPPEIKDTLEDMHDVQDRLEGIFGINTHWVDPEMPALYSKDGDSIADDMMTKEDLLEFAKDMELDGIGELEEYLLDFEHYHISLSNQIQSSDFFKPSLVETQPKVLSVKLKGNKKVQGLKNKNFYYGVLPPGILAAQAANQQQSLLE